MGRIFPKKTFMGGHFGANLYEANLSVLWCVDGDVGS